MHGATVRAVRGAGRLPPSAVPLHAVQPGRRGREDARVELLQRVPRDHDEVAGPPRDAEAEPRGHLAKDAGRNTVCALVEDPRRVLAEVEQQVGAREEAPEIQLREGQNPDDVPRARLWPSTGA